MPHGPAEQPIPPSEKLCIVFFILNLLMIIADNDGVGQNNEQLVTKTSISVGFIPVFSNSF